jgi:hypothetical protein
LGLERRFPMNVGIALWLTILLAPVVAIAFTYPRR